MDSRNIGKVFGPSNFYCPWKFRRSFSIMEGVMPDSIQSPVQNVRSMEDKCILKENKFGSCRIGGKKLYQVDNETIGERERNYSRHQIGENRPVESPRCVWDYHRSN